MFFSRYPTLTQVAQTPPPPVSTRPSGSSVALEWYSRTRLALDNTVQVPVDGFQRSAANTGLLRSTVDVVARLIPPVASTLPSARMVRLRCRRPTDIEAVELTAVPLPLTLTAMAVLVGTLLWPPSVMLPPPATSTLPMSKVAKPPK